MFFSTRQDYYRYSDIYITVTNCFLNFNYYFLMFLFELIISFLFLIFIFVFYIHYLQVYWYNTRLLLFANNEYKKQK